MKDQPRARVSIRTFGGVATDVDPSDATPGIAERSINVESQDEGILSTRRGFNYVHAEDIITSD